MLLEEPIEVATQRQRLLAQQSSYVSRLKICIVAQKVELFVRIKCNPKAFQGISSKFSECLEIV